MEHFQTRDQKTWAFYAPYCPPMRYTLPWNKSSRYATRHGVFERANTQDALLSILEDLYTHRVVLCKNINFIICSVIWFLFLFYPGVNKNIKPIIYTNLWKMFEDGKYNPQLVVPMWHRLDFVVVIAFCAIVESSNISKTAASSNIFFCSLSIISF